MEQSLSWEANRFLASQEIPRILWNPKVHYRIHKCPLPLPILIQLDPIHAPYLTSWRYILILSPHLHWGLPSDFFPSGLLLSFRIDWFCVFGTYLSQSVLCPASLSLLDTKCCESLSQTLDFINSVARNRPRLAVIPTPPTSSHNALLSITLTSTSRLPICRTSRDIST